MDEHVVQGRALTESDWTATPSRAAESISARIVAGPFFDERRNVVFASGRLDVWQLRQPLGPPGGISPKLTSITFFPGIDIFSVRGESSAFSSP